MYNTIDIDCSGYDNFKDVETLEAKLYSTFEGVWTQYGEGLLIKGDSELIDKSSPFALGNVTVTADNVNIRSTHRIKSDIVGTAENGKTYIVTNICHERDQSYTWYQISSEQGNEQWIADGDWCKFTPVSYLPTSDTVLE